MLPKILNQRKINNLHYFQLVQFQKRIHSRKEKLQLTKSFKDIKFRCSNLYFKRLQVYKDKIRSATISKTKSGKHFLSILVDINESEIVKFKKTGKSMVLTLVLKILL